MSVAAKTKTKIEREVKKLAAFDFDHTVVELNTDFVAIKLVEDQITPEIKSLYKVAGWTSYMREIFKLIHNSSISQSVLHEKICNIPEVDGMSHLFKKLHDDFNYDIIIISDSNSLFIDDWLVSQNLSEYIEAVFTNPARYTAEGLLDIQPYHHQTTCKLSTENLCKGQILEEYIASKHENGIDYCQTIYVGDGYNDFCPVLRLKEKDLAFPRIGYVLINDIYRNASKVLAKIHPWLNAYDISQALQVNERNFVCEMK